MHRTAITTRSQVSRGRRGAMLVEMLVAGILLTFVVVLVGPLLLQSNQVRRSAAQRQLATQIAANCLERLAAGESQQLAAANVQQGWDTSKWLPDLSVKIGFSNDERRRRATVSIGWTTPEGHSARPVQLTGWLPSHPEVPE